MKPAPILRQEQRVGECVSDAEIGKEHLRAALRDVLVAVCATLHRVLPLDRTDRVEGDAGGRERHLEVPKVPHVGRDAHDALARERLGLLEHRADPAGARGLIVPGGQDVEEILLSRRHRRDPHQGAALVKTREPAAPSRVDANIEVHAPKPCLAPPRLAQPRLTLGLYCCEQHRISQLFSFGGCRVAFATSQAIRVACRTRVSHCGLWWQPFHQSGSGTSTGRSAA